MSLFAQPDLSRPLIAPHPRMAELRRDSQIGLIVAICSFAYIACDGVTQQVFPWEALHVALFCLLGSAQLIVLIRRYQGIERGRFADALGDRRLLAERQPQPRLDTIPLPTEIILRSPHPSRIIPFVVSLVLTESFVLGLTRRITVSPENLLSLWPWFLILTLVWGIQLALILPSMGARICWLEVTPTTIRSQITSMQPQMPRWLQKGAPTSMQPQVISNGTWDQRIQGMVWHEARLFACYPNPNRWQARGSMIYELSSATDVVSWRWVPRRVPFSNQPLPLVSFEEHYAQVQALCDLVTAKTGLPLYDVSKGQRYGE